MIFMEKSKKKPYVAPSMKVYEIEPTQLLAGSGVSTTSVNDWGDGGSWGSYEMEEN